MPIQVRAGVASDSALILQFIRALAAYERLADAVVVTEDALRQTLFGTRPQAEVLIAELDRAPVGFALFFHNYSTFLGRQGLYLEDLFVLPEARGRGVGKALLVRLAKIATERQCGRFEWSVLDWNRDAIAFYEGIGAKPLSDWTGYRLDGEALVRLAGESESE